MSQRLPMRFTARYFYGSTPGIEQLRFELPTDALSATPAWDPDAANPPLSVREALRIGRVALLEFIENESEWEFDRARLLFDDSVDRWFYVLQFLRLRDECGIPVAETEKIHEFEIVVLMDGRTLHDPVRNPNKSDIPPLHRVITEHEGWIDLVREILRRGDDINAVDKDGRSALQLAVERHDADFVDFLIAEGADVHRLDGQVLSLLAAAALQHPAESDSNESRILTALTNAVACHDLSVRRERSGGMNKS